MWRFQVEVSSTWNQEQYNLAGTLVGLDAFEAVRIPWKLNSFWFVIEGGSDVWCYNPPSLNFHLPSNSEIDLGIFCIWASGGGGPLSWFFWADYYYWPHLQRQLLSVWVGDFGCGHFISCNVCLIATISWAVMNIAPNSASEAEDMIKLMIFQVLARIRSIGAWRCFQRGKYALWICCVLCSHCGTLCRNIRIVPCR